MQIGALSLYNVINLSKIILSVLNKEVLIHYLASPFQAFSNLSQEQQELAQNQIE